MTPFKPSRVNLNVVPPLCATMKKAEREFAAAHIVRVCQVKGDEWQPVTIGMLAEVLKADLDGNVSPWPVLARNPFFRPDFHLLADGTFARWTGDPGKSAIEFTEAGIEALRPWVLP